MTQPREHQARDRFRTATPADLASVQAVLLEAFNSPQEYLDELVEALGAGCVRLNETPQGDPATVGIVLEMGQFFQGQVVPTWALAAIATATASRGRGSALGWLGGVLREAHGRGIPLSTLYPATRTLYRKVGYDVGGYFVLRESDPRLINLFEKRGALVPVTPDLHPVVRDLYHRQAVRNNGLLDRPGWRWRQLLEDRPGWPNLFRYLALDEEGEPGGYIIYRVGGDSANGKAGWVEDLVVVHPTAGRRLVSLVAETRAQLGKISWPGGERDLFDTLIPERTALFPRYLPWFLRIVDLRGALESRGWNRVLTARLDLDVTDDVIAENNGRWRLDLEGGAMRVSRGGEGTVRLDIRALASLYGSCRTGRHLESLGLLAAPAEAHDTLDLIFSGPSAWMIDRF